MPAPAVVEVRYEPRGAAKKLLTSQDKFLVCSGPAGTGKTTAALWKLHLASLKYGHLRSLIVRQTQVALAGTTLVTFEEQVAAEALAAGIVTWFGGSRNKPAGYRYSSGAFIATGGLDKPIKIMGGNYDRIVVDEATETGLKAIEALMSRLRGTAPTYKQIALLCNPDSPQHWIKQACDEGRFTMLASVHADNPAYFHPDGTPTERGADYMSVLEALTGARRLRLLDGIWAAAEGLVYEDFNDAIHVVDGLPEGAEDWPRYLSVDFGYTNPFVCQWWAVDPDGRLWMYRELYRSRTLVEDHARKIRGYMDGERPPTAVVCDHDAEDRATLERHIARSTVAAKKTVSDGIQAVQARLRPAGDGKPRIFLCRDALVEVDRELADAKKPISTLAEMPGYVWEPPREGQAPKETPHKEDDHGMDALRYAISERDLGGRPNIRWL